MPPLPAETRSVARWLLLLSALGATGCGRATSGTCEESDTCSVEGDASPEAGAASPDATPDGTTPPTEPDAFAPDAHPEGGDTDANDATTLDSSVDGGFDAPPSPGCPSGQKTCAGVCVAVDDPAYGCTMASCAPCALKNASATCAGGACAVASCTAGYAHCTGSTAGCETSITTTSDCGSCTNECTGGTVCAGSASSTPACILQCPTSAPTNCGGSCADLSSDDQHCGTCSTSCDAPPSGGASTCVASHCVASCPSTPSTEKLCSNACVDTATSNANCGGCNVPCAKPANAASAQCTSSQCVVTCGSGYHLCNGACDSDTDLPTEDPCVVSESFGVFVSSSLGGDSNAGTRAAPFMTITAGLRAAASTGKRVYVCAETYPESITLEDGVDLFGYFTCAGGTWAVGSGRATINAPKTPAVVGSSLTKGARVDSFAIDSPAATADREASYGVIVTSALHVTLANDLIAAGAGWPGAPGTTGGSGSGQTSCTSAADSAVGKAGSAGSVGPAGTYASSGYVLGTVAGTGGTGSAGDCGGGGGAGGTGDCGSTCVSYVCCNHFQDPCTVGECCNQSKETYDHGGTGSPGTGGAPGQGGTGGAGGGASIALFASGASSVSVIGGSLTAGAGGVGGAGGAGGSGASGAAGSTGTTSACGGNGGSGGTAGGAGGAGGRGGGGAGGDSFAYYAYGGATVTLSGGATTAFASAVAGGAGGTQGPSGHSAAHN